MSDLNPEGVNVNNLIFPFLKETYKFQTTPSPNEFPDPNNSAKFKNGEFRVDDDGHPIIINLTIHNDGLVADTISSTLNSEKFLEDLYIRFSEVLKMPSLQSLLRKKLYLSELYVTIDKELDLINPKLKLISEYLSNTVEQRDWAFRFGGVSFCVDPIKKFVPTPFRFERAIEVPFKENRYYSIAPLPTEKHLELLDKLENLY